MSDALLILRPPADLDTGVSLREICGSKNKNSREGESYV